MIGFEPSCGQRVRRGVRESGYPLTVAYPSWTWPNGVPSGGWRTYSAYTWITLPRLCPIDLQ